MSRHYYAWTTARKEEPEPMPPSIEELILHWQAVRHNSTDADATLQRILVLVRPVFKARGILLDDSGKGILEGFLVAYDPYQTRQKALASLIEYLDKNHRKRRPITAGDRLQAAAYKGNGLGTFEIERAGHPEILAVNLATRAEKRAERERRAEDGTGHDKQVV